MILTALLDRLNGFAPSTTPQRHRQPPPPPTEPAPSTDRFGPATEVGLSAEALRRLETGVQDEILLPTAKPPVPADDAPILLKVPAPVSSEDLSRLHRIVTKHMGGDDSSLDRMFGDLRRAGLHPEQLAAA